MKILKLRNNLSYFKTRLVQSVQKTRQLAGLPRSSLAAACVNMAHNGWLAQAAKMALHTQPTAKTELRTNPCFATVSVYFGSCLESAGVSLQLPVENRKQKNRQPRVQPRNWRGRACRRSHYAYQSTRLGLLFHGPHLNRHFSRWPLWRGQKFCLCQSGIVAAN